MSYPLPPPGPLPQQGPPPQPGPRHRSVPAPRTAPGRRADPRDDAVAAPADVELDSYLAALAPTTDDPSLTGGFGHAQVFQLRLPALRIEQLRRIAQERGVSPGALAVDWVIDRLDREDTPTGPFAVVEEAEKRRRSPLRKLGRRSRRED
ncbi:hypothetical protein [Pseudonocardia humida]|uniref:CopG family transcriptional regulator n=1 Tax=Pseudonocardia humida TaxID=2800819 RepID=A0ABT1A2K9_9PSEU|nr:hypothetical protein [Pseudonocardia humida]MCO1657222.1 hypothetical protein [Pseudonocardia humida]